MIKGLITSLCGLLFLSGVLNAQSEPDSAYHSYEEVANFIDGLITAYPEIVFTESLGVSTRDSLPIVAIKVSDNAYLAEDEPAVLITGGIHAEELVGVEVCIYLLEYLTMNYGLDSQVTRWVDSLQIWLIPVVNPEGHNVVMEGLDITFRKNKRDNNLNGFFDFTPGDGGDSDGVDLNRNFDINWEDGESSIVSYQYRGPAPASENEIQAIQNFAQREKIVSAIFYHSSSSGFYNEKVIYPWNWMGNIPPYPDYQTLYFFAESIAVRLEKVTEVGPYDTYISLNPNGNSNDWLYANLGTIPFIIEIDSCTQPDAERLEEACLNQLEGLEYFFNRSLGPGIWGHITDADSGTPVAAQVTILEATSTSHLPRFADPVYGSFRRLIQPGDYSLLIEKDEYRSDTILVTVTEGSPTIIDIQLQFVNIEESRISTLRGAKLFAHPNPFNSAISIEYKLAGNQVSGAELSLYDILGNQVYTVELPGKKGSYLWEAIDTEHEKVNSGIYYATIVVDGKIKNVLKILYIK